MAMLGAAVGGKSTLSSKIFAGLILATFFILFIVPTFGKYCAQRGCCLEGRDDECNNPYPNLGPETLCYCDSFCNRTQGDCCPDFLEVCLGVKMRQPKKLIRGNINNTNNRTCCILWTVNVFIAKWPCLLFNKVFRFEIFKICQQCAQ